ncbi:MAG: phosphoribosylamine--glycine ligase [Gammaproteobacteria bacterium]|nr:phosphoribosylamine--glycine ligase [Gammaproteobacteria bacterium]
MKVLIVGGGGREHALAWCAAKSKRVSEVLVAPGNAGTHLEPGVRNVQVRDDDIAGLLDLAAREAVDLTIVGPEAPLVAGVRDAFDANGLACFGPSAQAAALEGSKSFTKEFLRSQGIPTADFSVVETVEEGRAVIAQRGAPLVVKADGLAAGKGVTICSDEDSAEQAVIEALQDLKFGEAGRQLVIEEFLEGEEASFICLCDGQTALPLATSQDHKARFDGDQGPNTGGMGAYSPAPVVTRAVHDRIMHEVINPTLAGMAARGAPYQGFLYAGLMITPQGAPKVIEFNVRLGDPEAQPLVMRLQGDLIEACLAALDGKLDRFTLAWDERHALGVVMVSDGYPGSYAKGERITMQDAEAQDVKVFHAGTSLKQGVLVTNGGRVLCVTALGDTIASAQARAYESAQRIDWPGARYRMDIGHRAVARDSAIN